MPNQHATTVTALSIPSTRNVCFSRSHHSRRTKPRVRVAARLWAESLASAR